SSPSPAEFANAANTDPDLPQNRDWARAIIHRMATSQLGEELVDISRVESTQQLDSAMSAAIDAGAQWRALPLATRSRVLIRIGDQLAAARGKLLEVMGS